MLLTHGKGCRVWDVDGNEYLDLRIGDWVMILGHANDRVSEAVAAQLEKGTQFGSADWDLSYRMASLLVERMPSVERIRFLVSGTEANLLAVRLARAFTGRTAIAKRRAATRPLGSLSRQLDGRNRADGCRRVLPDVAGELHEIPFNDPDGAEEILERERKSIAAVLVEPVQGAAGMIAASTEYLRRLRDVTARLGIVLIFDEVVTFPIAYGGAQAHHGVMPDLTTMSKAIGAGFHGGRRGAPRSWTPIPSSRRRRPGAWVSRRVQPCPLAAGIAVSNLHSDVHAACGDCAGRGADAELGRTYDSPHSTVSAPVRDALGASRSSTTGRGCRSTGRRSSTSTWRS